MKESIIIIGAGLSPDDISPRALRAIKDADILMGGRRQIDFFPDHKAEKIILQKNIAEHLTRVQKKIREKKTAVLASGDPNFFGIAALFYKVFDRDTISVIPNATAFQWAFARIKEPWDGAHFISVHGRDRSVLENIIFSAGTYVVYCDNKNSPAGVAAYLVERNRALGSCRAWIFDGLGGKDEKIMEGSLNALKKTEASPLSMMIIKNTAPAEKAYPPGIPDDLFVHTGGLITKRDVRLVALSRLQLRNGLVLWDIGAGSGSLSIESANMFPHARIYAVEKHGRRFDQLEKNVRMFNMSNVVPVKGSAPDILSELPRPDRVFIGGAGGTLEPILRVVKKKTNPGGHLVMNCVMLETLLTIRSILKTWKWVYDISAVQVSHLFSGKDPEYFKSENPVFVVHGSKE